MVKRATYLFLFLPFFAFGQTVTSFNTRTGAVTLNSNDVITAIGYSPANLATTSKKMTIAEIRALSGALVTNYFSTTDVGQEGEWYYDSTDTTTPDNTGTVLVTMDSKRIKRIYSGYKNVKWFGAKGNGVNFDDTAIQKALNLGGQVYIPYGQYLIDINTKKLNILSNTDLVLDENAIIKTNKNSSGVYDIILLNSVSNVTISGGQIIGDRIMHTDTVQESGFGIHLIASQNVSITRINVNNCWGDGIYVGGGDNINTNKNIIIRNVIADHNGRQGLTITNVNGMTVSDSYFTNTSQKAPKAGIDIEPNASQTVENLSLNNITCTGNDGYGIQAYADVNAVIHNIRFNNITTSNNGYGGISFKSNATGKIYDGSVFNFNSFTDNGLGLELNSVVNFNVENVKIEQLGSSAVIYLINISQVAIKKAEITISNQTNTNPGIYFGGSNSNVSILNCNILAVNTGISSTASVSNNAIQLTGNNITASSGPGINLANTSNSLIAFNNINNCGKEGLKCTNINNTNISNNIVINTSQLTSNTYSGISIEGISINNTLQGNLVRGGAGTNKIRYALSLLTSTSNNYILNNDFSNSGITGELNNGGTGNTINNYDFTNSKLLITGTANFSSLNGSKAIFTDANKNLTTSGPGTSSQFVKADGSFSGASGSATLDFPSTAPQSSNELTITVPGAVDGDVVSLGISNVTTNPNSCFTARVSGPNIVLVKFNNYSTTTIDPNSGVFKVIIFK